MEPLQVVLSIAGTIVIIVGAYYVTYFIGVKSSGASRGRNRNINILDRFSISKDKSFCLVEIAGKVYVVAVTNQSMTLLDTLDAATFAGTAAERGGAPSAGRSKANRYASGIYSNRMTNKLASFIAARLGRPDPNDYSESDLPSAEPGKSESYRAGSADSSGGEPGSDAQESSAPGKSEPAGGSFADSLRNAQSKGSGDEE